MVCHAKSKRVTPMFIIKIFYKVIHLGLSFLLPLNDVHDDNNSNER